MEVNLKAEPEIEVTRCDKGFVESGRAPLHDVRWCLSPREKCGVSQRLAGGEKQRSCETRLPWKHSQSCEGGRIEVAT